MTIRAAKPADAVVLCGFIAELAEHEGRPELATIDPGTLQALLFGDRALADGYLGVVDGNCAAYAIVAERFSSFRGTRYLYIEDMLIRPNYRGGGTGKQFLAFLAKQAVASGCERMEWSALDDNEMALGFYDHLGAEREGGVVHFALRGDAYRNLAKYDNQ